MDLQGFHIQERPDLETPVLIAGFDGWGNALGISSAMVVYIVGKLKASPFAHIDADRHYRYDEDRPTVEIRDGVLEKLDFPGGTVYGAGMDDTQNDLVLLRADEPSIGWQGFSDGCLALCTAMGVKRVITLGAMFDQVLHSDRIISGIASSQQLMDLLAQNGVTPINYQGPTAIHALIHSRAAEQGMESISLWAHCPFYLQETTHFGLLARMGDVLARLAGFELDVSPLERQWGLLEEKIQAVVNEDAKLREMIAELRRAKVRGSWESARGAKARSGKVIRLEDFLD